MATKPNIQSISASIIPVAKSKNFQILIIFALSILAVTTSLQISGNASTYTRHSTNKPISQKLVSQNEQPVPADISDTPIISNDETNNISNEEAVNMGQSNVTTSITGNVARVSVNGESIAVPTDGSTVTENMTSDDGSSSTVISVTGSQSSVGNSRSDGSTSINTSVRSRTSTTSTSNSGEDTP